MTYNLTYYIGLDSEGRVTVHTTDRLTLHEASKLTIETLRKLREA